jgi:hypothetical protein
MPLHCFSFWRAGAPTRAGFPFWRAGAPTRAGFLFWRAGAAAVARFARSDRSPLEPPALRRVMPALCALGVGLAGLLVADPTHAYCRTRTCEFRRDVDCQVDPRSGCSTVGSFVYWGNNCIPFAVQRDGSEEEEISAAEIDALVSDGFDTWTTVRCENGGTPALSSGSQGPIACDQVEYNCNVREDNSNIVMFRDDFVNSAAGLRFGVIALTTLTANLVSGELFDADIEINSRDEDFVVGGVSSGVNPNDPRDLRGVVNHELGHLLGLSHSEEVGALMRAAYEGTFEPGEDDIAGMCAALGPAASDPSCSVSKLAESTECLGPDTMCSSASTQTTDSEGCACGLAGAPSERGAAGAFGVATLALGYCVRRARRHSARRQRRGAASRA